MKPAAVLVAVLILLAFFAPLFTPYPASGSAGRGTGAALDERLQPPSWAHPCGTDELGRDIWARTLYSARVSLGIGLAARLAAVLLGAVIGVSAGYFGGRVDFVISRAIEVVLAFPSLILAIAIGVALEPGLKTVLIAIVVVSWVDVAILVRSLAATLKERDFVAAARALGDSPLRILRRQILPNCLPTIMVSFTFGIAAAVMVEASLSFLGIGASAGAADLPSWGWMIYTAEYHLAAAPWAAFAPGFFLALTVFGWNQLGDALRDRLDVKAELNT